jgi:hypothetical protein
MISQTDAEILSTLANSLLDITNQRNEFEDEIVAQQNAIKELDENWQAISEKIEDLFI